MSYVYVPIMIPILILLPYFVVKSYERSRRLNHIVESLAQGSRDLEQMSRLMDGPVTPWVGEKGTEQFAHNEKPNLKDFLILQDLRIIDLRNWQPLTDKTEVGTFLYGYRRLKVQKRKTRRTINFVSASWPIAPRRRFAFRSSN